ncbi:MAG: hypothetical protein A2498_05495 [Lentisphaerae bacterium RIFOXYC12_FULL_60_16]|nr:MAG: hypothetical protein A2498_05495 [Lentisphaerae bacterium RIFOXYC12_FULL_60_16]OGV75510.1 MAG: hypothetical protein A2340_02330 [Lentisphaerae bacterium RIFOXYB12_FULL_60_10]
MFRIQPWMILLVVAGVQPGPAADRYVRLDPTASAHPYETWDSAATNIHDAITAAGEGETVWITNGSYAVTNEIVLGSGVIIKSVNGRNVTTLRRTLASEYRLFRINHADAVLDGFTITNGYGRATTAGGSSLGGGVRLDAGTVRNCRIVGNTSRAGMEGESPNTGWGYGGGVYLTAGHLENTDVLNNIARGSGGSSSADGAGIFMDGAGTISSCTITGNYAYGTGNGQGHCGGVRIAAANGILAGSIIHGNRAASANNVAANYGGGVYLTADSVVSNCTISANRVTFWQSFGAGVYLTAGLVTDCMIVSNRAETGNSYDVNATPTGGGVYMTGGTLCNSIIARNQATQTGQIRPGATRGAGIALLGGRVEHCTITRNWGDRWGWGDGLYQTAGEVFNSIAFHNFNDTVTNYTADHVNLLQTGGTFGFSCTTNTFGLSGTSNVIGDPGFISRLTGNYRLSPGSPCIDTGTNLASIASDLDGNPRSRDGNGDAASVPDMGAYEAAPLNTGPLQVNITASPEAAFDAATVNFTARVAGADTTGITYTWDYTNDGTPDDSGTDKGSVSHTYSAPGYYTVKVTAENSAGTSIVTRVAGVRIFPSTVYMKPGGSGTFPFDTPAKATTNLQPAIDAAAPGATVLLDDGIYQLTTPAIIRRGITLTSVNGPADSFVERKAGANTRLLVVMHPDAIVERLTLRNANFQRSGMAYGGALWMSAGMVRNCVITNNLVQGLPNQPGAGGGVYMTGGTLRNNLLFRNGCRSSNSSAHGGGIHLTAGMIQNCTVVSNASEGALGSADTADTSRGGGVYATGGSASNSIVVFNWIRNPTPTVGIQISGTNRFGYSHASELATGVNGNLATVEPLFVDRLAVNFILHGDSPALDAGRDQDWMENTQDLGMTPRIQGRRVDMGAYETIIIPKGTVIIVR